MRRTVSAYPVPLSVKNHTIATFYSFYITSSLSPLFSLFFVFFTHPIILHSLISHIFFHYSSAFYSFRNASSIATDRCLAGTVSWPACVLVALLHLFQPRPEWCVVLFLTLSRHVLYNTVYITDQYWRYLCAEWQPNIYDRWPPG